jgi:polysaccharide biosynthesis/export protein
MKDGKKDIQSFNESGFPDYTLKSNDELYINISSLDEAAANVFSTASDQSQTLTPYSASMMSYTVDKEGYLLLPVIGNIFVKGKTLSQVSIILRDSLYQVLNQPIVNVRLVNRYVSILGEVRLPGHYQYSQEKLSIFDAIGLAGDITDYGNRDEVILIRNENGENIRTKIDLSRSDILASEYYNLRPNDIIYVKPLRNKVWLSRQVPLNLLLTTITTALLIYSIIK